MLHGHWLSRDLLLFLGRLVSTLSVDWPQVTSFLVRHTRHAQQALAGRIAVGSAAASSAVAVAAAAEVDSPFSSTSTMPQLVARAPDLL